MFCDIVVDVEGGLAQLKLFDHVFTCLDCLLHLRVDALKVCEDLVETGTLFVIELKHFIDEVLPQGMEFGR